MKKYKFLEHTADIKFQAFGRTPEKIFKNSAYALIKSIYPKRVKKKIKKTINTSGKDIENLMYNFLEEFLVLFDGENFIVSKIKEINVDIKKFKITAILVGDYSENYEIKMHVKAITYSEMFVKKEDGKWIAQVVLDI